MDRVKFSGSAFNSAGIRGIRGLKLPPDAAGWRFMTTTDGQVNILLNGNGRGVPAGGTVLEVLRSLELEPSQVLVEWNGTALFSRDFGATPITEGGRMEILRIAQGG
ncbi:MAG: sulfur carrier protein ThiS [Verrucomicrobiaceae bacterium]|nr:MAG: sulfur carrier protein ThiS [Verrucomicrobiaceae bacterium]